SPASIAVSLPVSGTTGPAPDAPRLSGLRRPEWRFPGMDGLGQAMVLTGCPLREYPFVLVSVAKGHGSAVVALAGPPERRIGVTRGDPIPGTDLVVDGLRRRMLYANGKSGALVDASTMTLQRPRDGWSFTAGVEAVSFSGERVAMIRFPE